MNEERCVAVCCSVLQWVAVCCSVLQCSAVCYATHMNEELDVAKRQKDESDHKFVAHIWMRSSVLQCVAARCSVLQCAV